MKLVSIKELYYDARPTKSQDSLNVFYTHPFPTICRRYVLSANRYISALTQFHQALVSQLADLIWHIY